MINRAPPKSCFLATNFLSYFRVFNGTLHSVILVHCTNTGLYYNRISLGVYTPSLSTRSKGRGRSASARDAGGAGGARGRAYSDGYRSNRARRARRERRGLLHAFLLRLCAADLAYQLALLAMLLAMRTVQAPRASTLATLALFRTVAAIISAPRSLPQFIPLS